MIRRSLVFGFLFAVGCGSGNTPAPPDLAAVGPTDECRQACRQPLPILAGAGDWFLTGCRLARDAGPGPGAECCWALGIDGGNPVTQCYWTEPYGGVVPTSDASLP